MADTYSQLYVHIIFSVKGREPLIKDSIKNELYAYIGGIIKNKGQKPIAINGTADHIHILVGFKPDKSISELVREIKSNSSKYVNENKFLPVKFHWQEGFGAFTYSHSQITTVANYIARQDEHHKRKDFTTEYEDFLKKFNVKYDDKYIL
ncbi:MAG: transposase [Ignavibacteriae bacterium HGW-Ignavibacteriae-3]|nr:MAG: transposase [Ignavibacteriae bacterium HGW-Ignavibacteriae-3]